MDKITEMSFSQFSRFKREQGIGLSQHVPAMAHVKMSKLRKAIQLITREEFQGIKAQYKLGKNTTRDVLINRLVSRAESMDTKMVDYLMKEFLSEGAGRLVELSKMNFTAIRRLSGAVEPDDEMVDHITAY